MVTVMSAAGAFCEASGARLRIGAGTVRATVAGVMTSGAMVAVAVTVPASGDRAMTGTASGLTGAVPATMTGATAAGTSASDDR